MLLDDAVGAPRRFLAKAEGSERSSLVPLRAGWQLPAELLLVQLLARPRLSPGHEGGGSSSHVAPCGSAAIPGVAPGWAPRAPAAKPRSRRRREQLARGSVRVGSYTRRESSHTGEPTSSSAHAIYASARQAGASFLAAGHCLRGVVAEMAAKCFELKVAAAVARPGARL